MESQSQCKIPETQTLCLLLSLSLIRGSFSVLIHYGMKSYETPGLLFLLRTPGTIILFVISVLYFASRDTESKLEILSNFKSSRSYKRAAILGFLQLCGPYMLFMYGMKYLTPTIGAVFMCATPWLTSILEQYFVVTLQKTGEKNWNAIGSIVGTIGMIAVCVANICLVSMDTSCQARYDHKNVTRNISNSSKNIVDLNLPEKVELSPNTCLTSLEITTAFLALCGATCLWSISAVFSRLKHVNLHFMVGGLLNNVFGGLFAGILWLIVEQHVNTRKVVWNSSSGALSVVFLSVACSWGASVILYYLHRKISIYSTNRVICLVPLITWLEDIIFLKHLSHMFTWIIIVEVIGVVLIVIGLYISSFQKIQKTLQGAHAQLLPDYVSEDEEDGLIQRQVNELTGTAQSEDELMQSGTSSMQDSVEPPMIHYADNENEDDGEVW